MGHHMSARARPRITSVPHHVIQSGSSGSPVFLSDADYRFYLMCLHKGAERHQCAIHAYVLMPDHVHLLVSPGPLDGLSLMMRYVSNRYVQYFNYVYDRTGRLWEGRFRSGLIDDERYLLKCYRYIESNPVRARIVESAGKYPWSSYAYHATGREDRVVHDHATYVALGATPHARQRAYRWVFRQPLDGKELDEIEVIVNGGLVPHSDRHNNSVPRPAVRRIRTESGDRPERTNRKPMTP